MTTRCRSRAPILFEAYNVWRLECADRNNAYNLTTVEARDQNAIEL